MGGNYYNDYRCDAFDVMRQFIDMCGRFSENNKNTTQTTNNITIINNNITIEPEKNLLKPAIVFY